MQEAAWHHDAIGTAALFILVPDTSRRPDRYIAQRVERVRLSSTNREPITPHFHPGQPRCDSPRSVDWRAIARTSALPTLRRPPSTVLELDHDVRRREHCTPLKHETLIEPPRLRSCGSMIPLRGVTKTLTWQRLALHPRTSPDTPPRRCRDLAESILSRLLARALSPERQVSGQFRRRAYVRMMSSEFEFEIHHRNAASRGSVREIVNAKRQRFYRFQLFGGRHPKAIADARRESADRRAHRTCNSTRPPAAALLALLAPQPLRQRHRPRRLRTTCTTG